MYIFETGNIRLEIDTESTRKLYQSQKGFTCTCGDCTRYSELIPSIQKALEGFDTQSGIDLTKDIGHGMDELISHTYPDHNLLTVPYYLVGTCTVQGEPLPKQNQGPVWPTTPTAHWKVNDLISFTLVNTTGSLDLAPKKDLLTLWLEYTDFK